MSLLHTRRFTAPPEPIAELLRSGHQLHLVRGQILPQLPLDTQPVELPFDLQAPTTVLARVDVEERVPLSRPRLLTLERARDFYFSDGSATPALARISDGEGRLHPDVELHLGAPFVEHELRPGPDSLTAFVRTLAVGDPVYVLGRAQLVDDLDVAGQLVGQLTGLRQQPLVARFAGDTGPLHLYDEAAFRRLALWYALPWYRKLSLWVRNR